MSRYQRKVLLSTASGIALENMDIMFYPFRYLQLSQPLVLVAHKLV